MEEAIKHIETLPESSELKSAPDTILPENTQNAPEIEPNTQITETTDSISEKPPVLDLFEEALQKNDNYQSGFWNGYFGLSKDTLETYLSEKGRYDKIFDQLLYQETLLQENLQKIANHKQKYQDTFGELTQINYQLDYQINLRQRRGEELAETEKQIQTYKTERENLRNNNSFLGGILFLLAAIVFIAGDLIISHEIVAYALNIKNNVEAWAFAVGLAMVSVLLKPAYDRLIEYPYLEDKTLRSKRVYLIFKILVVIFTIVTLCILGYFRYEAYRADQLKNSLNSTILSIQEEESSQNLALIEELSRKTEKLSQDLVQSPSGMWAFVLSGVMFAIAGAICLGIAFPIIVAYIRIWFQIPIKLRKLQKIRASQLSSVEELEQIISEQTAIAEAKKSQLEALGNLEELQKQRQEIADTILKLKKDLHTCKVELQIYELNLGYEKGQHAFKLEENKKQEQTQNSENLAKELTSLQENLNGNGKANLQEVLEKEEQKENTENAEPKEEVVSESTTEAPQPNRTISSKVLSKIRKK
ncbi:hypothetical protein [Raineya sp.]